MLEKNLAASESSKLSNLPTNLISWLFGNPFFTKASFKKPTIWTRRTFPARERRKHSKGKLKQSKSRWPYKSPVWCHEQGQRGGSSFNQWVTVPSDLQKLPWNSICGQEKVGRQNVLWAKLNGANYHFYTVLITHPHKRAIFISTYLASHHTVSAIGQRMEGGEENAINYTKHSQFDKKTLKKSVI